MTKKLKKRLIRIIIGTVLFAALFVVAKIHVIDGFPREWIIFGAAVAIYLFVGYDVLFRAGRNILHGKVFDENLLMTIATIAAFAIGEYEEAVAVMVFYQIGEWFQDYAVGKSRKSIKDLMKIAPEYANVERDGELVEIDPSEVEIGDEFVVKPGERVPIDGIVLSGLSMLDTSSLTGESVPRTIREGDEIISGCINMSGVLRVRAEKRYEDSTVSRIMELVENASSRKAPVEHFITRFAKYYTPAVTIAAVLLAVIPPLFFHQEWGEWIRRACTFLVISCPCAVVISVPLGFFGGIGSASRIGVLVKGSNYLEALANVKTMAFDKTGTLTKGEFSVTAVETTPEVREKELLEAALTAEQFSTHPIAEAIRVYGEKQGISHESNYDIQEVAGQGIIAEKGGNSLFAGNLKLVETFYLQKAGQNPTQSSAQELIQESAQDCTQGSVCEHEQSIVQNSTQDPVHEFTQYSIPEHTPNADQISSLFSSSASDAGTVVYVGNKTRLLGRIVISDTLKDGAKESIAAIRRAGVEKTVLLTGDRKQTGDAVAKSLGIDETRSELLPADKVTAVESLLSDDPKKKVAFVGDGINDAPVLVRSDVGIAMGSLGSDAAVEAADIVLMDDDIRKIAKTFRIARKTIRIVRQDIAIALGVKFVVLCLGALGFAPLWLAIFADVGVAVIAILNSMRTMKIVKD